MSVTYSAKNLRAINTFESITGVDTRNVILEPEKAFFVVPEGKAGMAIGKGGETVTEVKKKLGKEIKIYEYSDNIGKFVNNVVAAQIRGIEIDEDDDEKVVKIDVSERNKGKVVGRNGERIDNLKKLLSQTHNVDDVVVD